MAGARRMGTINNAGAPNKGRENLTRITDRGTSTFDVMSDPKSYFVLGFNLSKDIGDDVQNSGLDSVASAGQVLTLHIENTAPTATENSYSDSFAATACDVLFICDHARGIELKDGAVTLGY